MKTFKQFYESDAPHNFSNRIDHALDWIAAWYYDDKLLGIDEWVKNNTPEYDTVSKLAYLMTKGELEYARDLSAGASDPDQAFSNMIKKHNSLRCNIDAIRKSIAYHDDYHIKPVLDKNLSMVSEVEELIKELNVPDHKIWAMPAGDDRTSLFESYGPVMNFVRDRGWRYTGRSHIMAFDTERCV